MLPRAARSWWVWDLRAGLPPVGHWPSCCCAPPICFPRVQKLGSAWSHTIALRPSRGKRRGAWWRQPFPEPYPSDLGPSQVVLSQAGRALQFCPLCYSSPCSGSRWGLTPSLMRWEEPGSGWGLQTHPEKSCSSGPGDMACTYIYEFTCTHTHMHRRDSQVCPSSLSSPPTGLILASLCRGHV